jgi:hypothetical protein
MRGKEEAATTVLALSLAEFSVKSRSGGTDEPEADLTWPIWAGQVPVRLAGGTPIAERGVAPGLAPTPLPPGLR